jgi:hypothetical protein
VTECRTIEVREEGVEVDHNYIKERRQQLNARATAVNQKARPRPPSPLIFLLTNALSGHNGSEVAAHSPTIYEAIGVVRQLLISREP